MPDQMPRLPSIPSSPQITQWSPCSSQVPPKNIAHQATPLMCVPLWMDGWTNAHKMHQVKIKVEFACGHGLIDKHQAYKQWRAKAAATGDGMRNSRG